MDGARGASLCPPSRWFGLSSDWVRARVEAHPVGFSFQDSILHDRHAGADRVTHPPLTLLHHMRQFVAEQLLSLHSVWLEPAGREVDVGAHGEGDGADALGLGADMDA